MDKSAIVMGIGFLLLFMIPILLVIYNQNHKKQKLKKQIESFAKKHQLQISNVEITHRIILGIDEKQQKLIFAEITASDPNFEIIDLIRVKDAVIFAPHTKTNGIEEVAIHLNGDAPVKELIFYKDSIDIGVDALVSNQVAKKWLNIIKAA